MLLVHILHNVKSDDTAAQDSQSEANEGASPPLHTHDLLAFFFISGDCEVW